MKPKLHALDPAATYAVRDVDRGETREIAGKELCEQGIDLAIDSAPGSKLFLYKKVTK